MRAEAKRHVLDSFALLSYLQSEPGGEKVKSILKQAQQGKSEAFLSIINYGETIYITEREKGLPEARKLIATVDQLPINIVEADRKLTFMAAHLKANHPIAYADAFAVALALDKQATVVTGDPEFQPVESIVKVEWL